MVTLSHAQIHQSTLENTRPGQVAVALVALVEEMARLEEEAVSHITLYHSPYIYTLTFGHTKVKRCPTLFSPFLWLFIPPYVVYQEVELLPPLLVYTEGGPAAMAAMLPLLQVNLLTG